jgi:hypothetical protein
MWSPEDEASGAPNLPYGGRSLHRPRDCILQPSRFLSSLFATRPALSAPGSLAAPPVKALARAMLETSGVMKDLLFTIITIGFFAGAWLYAKACEKL